jgi:hypothetical protein
VYIRHDPCDGQEIMQPRYKGFRAEAFAYLKSIGVERPSRQLVDRLCEVTHLLRIFSPAANFDDVLALALEEIIESRPADTLN